MLWINSLFHHIVIFKHTLGLEIFSFEFNHTLGLEMFSFEFKHTLGLEIFSFEFKHTSGLEIFSFEFKYTLGLEMQSWNQTILIYKQRSTSVLTAENGRIGGMQ